MKKKYFLPASLFTLFAFFTYLLLPPKSPLSPLASFLLEPPPPPIHDSTYTILGFLPYWNRTKLTRDALDSVTHLAYFTLHLKSTGELVTLERPGQEDPGYTNYRRLLNSLPSSSPPPLLLTFMPYDQDALTAILNSHSTRRRAVNTITQKLQESQAAGLNIDFEPLGAVPPSLRDNFTLFIKELSQSLTNHYSLSISIYPSAASRPRLWDLAKLAPHTDYFVVMTYDYHLPGGPKTGPNSPLRGAGELFEHDILTNLAELSRLVPSRKLLLGIPFYGYEWATDSTDKYTATESRAAVASLERIEELIKQNTLELLWDRNSLTPYAIRREEGEIISQIYYESVDSIKLKLELVKQAELGGIAIWALGYEGDNQALWHTIKSLNTP